MEVLRSAENRLGNAFVKRERDFRTELEARRWHVNSEICDHGFSYSIVSSINNLVMRVLYKYEGNIPHEGKGAQVALFSFPCACFDRDPRAMYVKVVQMGQRDMICAM